MSRNKRIQKAINEHIGCIDELVEVKNLPSGRWGFITENLRVGSVELYTDGFQDYENVISMRAFKNDDYAIDIYEQLGVTK